MIKLIACDLDGTLIRWFESEENPINEDDLAAIRNIEITGVKFFINTSRHHQFLPVLMNDHYYNKNVIGGAGATIQINNQLNRQIHFTQEEVQILTNYFKDSSNLQLLAVSIDREFISTNHQSKRFLTLKEDPIDYEFGTVSPILLQDYPKEELPIINYFFINPNEDYDHSYIKQLEQDLPGFDFIDCGTAAIQIVKEKVNKKEAIEYLMKMYNYSKDEVAVIGDGTNDIVMFEAFPFSFVMNQAKEDVKKHANYEVTSVKEAIEIITKINKGDNDETNRN